MLESNVCWCTKMIIFGMKSGDGSAVITGTAPMQWHFTNDGCLLRPTVAVPLPMIVIIIIVC